MHKWMTEIWERQIHSVMNYGNVQVKQWQHRSHFGRDYIWILVKTLRVIILMIWLRAKPWTRKRKYLEYQSSRY